MKTKIISLAIVCTMLLSVFALASCDIGNDEPETLETQSQQIPEDNEGDENGKDDDEAPAQSDVAESETTDDDVRVEMERKDLIKYVKERTVTVSTDVGTGTGFFIDDDGTLVTNYHVIEGVSQIKIIMENNATIDVDTIVDFTELYDLAILKANIKNTPYLDIYSGELIDGESVCAVGSPVGYQGISTEGMISKSSEKIGVIDCIVSTATINHGNSGGPLVNFYGEVIGVNTFLDSRDSNLSFAVNIKNLERMSMDKNWSVSRYSDWYTKEIHRSYKLYDVTESTSEKGVFRLSTLHTYQEVTGSACISSGDGVASNDVAEYDERCQYHRYNYTYSEFEKYTEYIFGRGFEYVDSSTDFNLVTYLYVNDFDGTCIKVYVEDNKYIILQVFCL